MRILSIPFAASAVDAASVSAPEANQKSTAAAGVTPPSAELAELAEAHVYAEQLDEKKLAIRSADEAALECLRAMDAEEAARTPPPAPFLLRPHLETDPAPDAEEGVRGASVPILVLCGLPGGGQEEVLTALLKYAPARGTRGGLQGLLGIPTFVPSFFGPQSLRRPFPEASRAPERRPPPQTLPLLVSFQVHVLGVAVGGGGGSPPGGPRGAALPRPHGGGAGRRAGGVPPPGPRPRPPPGGGEPGVCGPAGAAQVHRRSPQRDGGEMPPQDRDRLPTCADGVRRRPPAPPGGTYAPLWTPSGPPPNKPLQAPGRAQLQTAPRPPPDPC
eukprot:110401-Prorocentrum_minimum.AAC.4